MFWFKECPRCSGDLYEEEDVFGLYVSCMQCGFQKDLPAPEELAAVPHYASKDAA